MPITRKSVRRAFLVAAAATGLVVFLLFLHLDSGAAGSAMIALISAGLLLWLRPDGLAARGIEAHPTDGQQMSAALGNAQFGAVANGGAF